MMTSCRHIYAVLQKSLPEHINMNNCVVIETHAIHSYLQDFITMHNVGASRIGSQAPAYGPRNKAMLALKVI